MEKGLQVLEVGEVELSSFGFLVEFCELGVGEVPEVSSEESLLEVASELSTTAGLGVDDDASLEVDVVL